MAAEPRDPRVALWRYRVVATVLGTVAFVLLLWLFLALSGVTNGEDPGLGGALSPATAR